jgi:predicted nuclease with RNAse H fold
VGAQRKGFDVALIDERRLLRLERGLDREAVVAAAERDRPALVGIDSPRSCAPSGQSARESEREISRRICGIRWTPDETRVRGNAYYAWIVEGLALFEALIARQSLVIEVFPTASWTRWAGPRGVRTRARWTQSALPALAVEGIPERTNQDLRDAIAAAVTARQHTHGLTETVGEIVVPIS